MTFAHDSLAVNARGGTELMKFALQEHVPSDLLDEFQIYVSRVEEPLDESKVRIYWLQDLPDDPAAAHLANGGWNNFHKLVFASNWQMQAFINKFNIPWSKCIVLHNCITPIPTHEKPKDKIRLAYWSTPHRGLNILVPVFDALTKKHDNIELDVFSSFKLYGWEERDQPYQELFKACEEHPLINYHGSIPNEDLKKALENVHILAYPSTWIETSCITLMEAMSAGLLCVHPNLGALYETAGNWTNMYQWDEDVNRHANLFYQVLDDAIMSYNDEGTQSRLNSQKAYANVFYNWNVRSYQWEALLRSLVDQPRELPKSSGEFFHYKTL